MPKGYRHTWVVTDDATGERVAQCDLTGRAVFSTLEIADQEGRTWTVRPNRKIMPSRWIVSAPDGGIAMQLDQKTLPSLVNPLHRTALACLDSDGDVRYTVVDPRTSVADRLIGSGPLEWAIVEREEPVAKLVRLPRRDPPASNLRARLLRKLIPDSDPGLVTLGARHLFPGPVALAMQVLLEELTDVS